MFIYELYKRKAQTAQQMAQYLSRLMCIAWNTCPRRRRFLKLFSRPHLVEIRLIKNISVSVVNRGSDFSFSMDSIRVPSLTLILLIISSILCLQSKVRIHDHCSSSILLFNRNSIWIGELYLFNLRIGRWNRFSLSPR